MDEEANEIRLENDVPATRKRDLAWLAVVLLACAISMSVDLGARDTTHTMEYVAVATSQETWLGWHAGTPAPWYAAFDDGAPRVRKPPLIVWLNALAWIDLDPATTPPETLLVRARMVSVTLALLTLVGVFWAGCMLLGSRGALLAALVAGSMLFLQRQGRTASYDVHVTGWATLAVASAFWAMRPFGPAPALRRRLAGWLGCGAATTLAVYTKNPLPVAFVFVAVAAAIALSPGRRVANLVWLVAMCGLAVALVAPWYILIFRAYPGSFDTVTTEFQPARGDDAQPPYYYLGLFALVAPWTIWLIAGLAHPFTGYVRARRGPRLIAWLWFVGIFVLMSIPEAKQQRYILPILPAAALLVAAVWVDHQSLADRGARDRGIRPFIWIHWIALMAASIALGVAAADPAWLAARGVDVQDAFGGIGIAPALVAVVALVAIAGFGLRRHVAWRPYPAAIAGGVWGLVMLGVLWHAYAGGAAAVNPISEPARALRVRLGEAPLRVLRIREGGDRRRRLDEVFRIHFGRLVPPVGPEGLGEYAETAGAVAYVLAADEPDDRVILTAAGFTDLDAVQTDQAMRLWRR